MQRYYDNNKQPPFVGIEVGEYLVEAMTSVGWMKDLPSGGFSAINNQDVYFFAENSGVDWTHWERQTMIEMSRAFLAGFIHGRSPFALSPVEMEEGDADA